MKRLVICLDGTWNRADQEENGVPCPTNVVQMAIRAAKRAVGETQVIYYDQGVGTGNLVDRLTGGASGNGLEDNIYDAYRFLIANYEPDDELFVFGFSRGAFTARSLVGMIRKCGILRRSSVREYRAARRLYRSGERPDDEGPVLFREEHSIGGIGPIMVRFLGVWDTVGALGIPIGVFRWITRNRYKFHDVELSRAVQAAYHALAIDEQRGPFAPTLWSYLPKEGQTVEQVWFSGAHSDVGGGYAEAQLSDFALDWMLEKARAAGLALDEEAMAAYPLAPDHLHRPHNSNKGFYRLLPGKDRTIGVTVLPSGDLAPGEPLDPTQRVHESVLRRWDEDPGYRPEALRDYFGRVGDPRASG